jgi:hypothetical protein
VPQAQSWRRQAASPGWRLVAISTRLIAAFARLIEPDCAAARKRRGERLDLGTLEQGADCAEHRP